MPVVITLFYASLLAILFLVLSARVVSLRRKFHVGVGTGGQTPLELAVRAHGNFAEYVPLALLLMLALELGATGSGWLLHLLGSMLVVGRVLHGLAGLNLSAGTSPGRFVGTLLTWLVLLVSAIAGLVVVVGGWLAT
jgi:uncharacterized protein